MARVVRIRVVLELTAMAASECREESGGRICGCGLEVLSGKLKGDE